MKIHRIGNSNLYVNHDESLHFVKTKAHFPDGNREIFICLETLKPLFDKDVEIEE